MLAQIGLVAATDHAAATAEVRRSRIGSLLEFSRAVHAEMDALLNAARCGRSTRATRMFVSTFPCHYCARHIVAAGVDEVQYIEPYPKSQAFKLHDDSITADAAGWTAPSVRGTHVLFRPFSGIAPRMYVRAFTKDRNLKDDNTGVMKIGDPAWGSTFDLTRVSYAELEALLSREGS
jgi:tRNA(Arg) A34 adenosine deaminase TadA